MTYNVNLKHINICLAVLNVSIFRRHISFLSIHWFTFTTRRVCCVKIWVSYRIGLNQQMKDNANELSASRRRFWTGRNNAVSTITVSRSLEQGVRHEEFPNRFFNNQKVTQITGREDNSRTDKH